MAEKLPKSSNDRDPVTPVEPTGAQYVFQWNGRGWRLKFGGGDSEILPASDGLFYLHLLVSHRAKPVSPSELRGEKHKFSGGTSRSADQQSEIPSARDVAPTPSAINRRNEVAEKKEALSHIQSRLRKVENELDDAVELRNEEEVLRLQDEKQKLEDSLSKATGLGGRIRLEPSQAKKDRDTVRKTIKLAIEQLPNEAAAVHFKKSIPLEDTEFCYEPEHSIEWLL